jgi:hypothetical protein
MDSWWLITWTTYGTWLPGDPRGFRTWRAQQYVAPPARYAANGEPTYSARQFRALHQKNLDACQPTVLNGRWQQIVLESLRSELDTIAVDSAIVAIAPTHVHWLARFGPLGIRPIVARLKAAATRALHGNGMDANRVWAKGCSMKSLRGQNAFDNAFAYVERHRSEGAVIYVSPKYASRSTGPTASGRLG